MISALGLFLIIISPLCMGLPWVPVGGAHGMVSKICFAYVVGYFLRHTLFHVIAMPMTLLQMHFSTFSMVFTITLVVICIISLHVSSKRKLLHSSKLRLTRYEIIYAVCFILLLGIQLYITIFMDPTNMTYDDATYTVYSSDALASNYMMNSNPYTGVFVKVNYRFMQSSLLFPAYVTRMTGLPVTMVERTISYALNLIIAYACYYYMSEDLFSKNDNRIAFLVILSLLYLFGYYSHYSMTFRLLGPNSQGKAILAVIFVPLILVLFRKNMINDYNRRFGILLLLLSDAACSLSLMGAGYMICITGPMVLLSLIRKQRQWNHLIYIVWGCILPCAYIGIYLFMKHIK